VPKSLKVKQCLVKAKWRVGQGEKRTEARRWAGGCYRASSAVFGMNKRGRSE